ncbi:hypothetical protein NPIL_405551 [Nephila pilipes]|uniref:Uncharacterized protein n=1 Tax=Nephila pilipes TaxID=299642 RepID=A0A8X6MXI4_NEPPI|nr:hypothetical protein NPIL_697551 [Nephila pilipes]GFT78084.1 hypothetical protein NPIL_405551 [Nephila pilipes]
MNRSLLTIPEDKWFVGRYNDLSQRSRDLRWKAVDDSTGAAHPSNPCLEKCDVALRWIWSFAACEQSSVSLECYCLVI